MEKNSKKSPSTSPPLIRFERVSKWYGQVLALSQISLDIPSGIVGLLGPNGSGKSTFLQLLAGELRPSQGVIKIDNQSVWNNLSLKNRLGYCPDSDGFYEFLTGREFLVHMAELSGWNPARARQKSEELLDEFSLTEVGERKISTYSRGMRQRLKLAQTLTGDPEILFLDEPLQGTDPLGRTVLLNKLRHLADQGMTILFSSHVLHEIETITDRIIILYSGRLLAHGKMDEIRALLNSIPRRVSLQVDRPRELARHLSHKDYLQGFHFFPQRETLEITTLALDQFLEELPQIILEKGMEIREIEPLDDNLEQIFTLLTQKQNLLK